jgi:endonuclease-3 related protein
MLSAAWHPVFVVDACTKRVLFRHGLLSGTEGYHEAQRPSWRTSPQDRKIFNEHHALLVMVGKRHCRKSAP